MRERGWDGEKERERAYLVRGMRRSFQEFNNVVFPNNGICLGKHAVEFFFLFIFVQFFLFYILFLIPKSHWTCFRCTWNLNGYSLPPFLPSSLSAVNLCPPFFLPHSFTDTHKHFLTHSLPHTHPLSGFPSSSFLFHPHFPPPFPSTSHVHFGWAASVAGEYAKRAFVNRGRSRSEAEPAWGKCICFHSIIRANLFAFLPSAHALIACICLRPHND